MFYEFGIWFKTGADLAFAIVLALGEYVANGLEARFWLVVPVYHDPWRLEGVCAFEHLLLVVSEFVPLLLSEGVNGAEFPLLEDV